MATLSELKLELQVTRAAIRRLQEDGERWQRGQKSHQSARLSDLQERERWLERRIASLERGGVRAREVAPDV